jgi:hypothetical protein
MKSWEFCVEGQRPGAAIREIKSDLLGRLIEFPRTSEYYLLRDLEMVQRSNGTATYWRACPEWETFYVSCNDQEALRQLDAGTYEPLCRAGGAKYDEKITLIHSLLKNGVIKV